MRGATLFLAVCQAVLLAGCSESSNAPTSASDPAGPPALDRFRTAPISGVCETSYELSNFQFLPPPNETLLSRADYDDGGPCQLSHLGAGTLANSGSIEFTPTIGHGRGTFTITAANGDRLEGTEEVDYLQPDADGHFGFHGVRVITGGTGRFAGAQGTLTMTGIGSSVESTTQQSHAGRLQF
jgi:hypothetical protein